MHQGSYVAIKDAFGLRIASNRGGDEWNGVCKGYYPLGARRGNGCGCVCVCVWERMASHTLDKSIISKRAIATVEDSIIYSALSLAGQAVIGGSITLVKDADIQQRSRATPDYQRFLDDHVLRFAYHAFSEYLVHGLVVIALEEREVASGVALAPVVVPCIECDFMHVWEKKKGQRIEVTQHLFRDAADLHVYQFGQFNCRNRSVDSKVGALLHAYNEYFNLTTAAMSATVRATKTPLVLQRAGGKHGGAAAFMPPVDLSLYDGLSGEMHAGMTEAIRAVQDYEYTAQQRVLSLMNVHDSLMDQMRRNNVNPDDPTFTGGMARVTLPDDTHVARVEYPALPYTPEVAYTRYIDTVFRVIGITSNAIYADIKHAALQRFVLSKQSTHRYITEMNRLLRFVHDLLVIESGADYIAQPDDTHTLAIPAPGVDFDDALRLASLPQISPEDIRTMIETALSVRFRGTPPEETREDAVPGRREREEHTSDSAAKPGKARAGKEGEEHGATDKGEPRNATATESAPGARKEASTTDKGEGKRGAKRKGRGQNKSSEGGASGSESNSESEDERAKKEKASEQRRSKDSDASKKGVTSDESSEGEGEEPKREESKKKKKKPRK